jgi:heme-degrading monooxygenase HmoA
MMITRLVKMTFAPEMLQLFEAAFANKEELIRAYPGCLEMNIYRSASDPRLRFTISRWENETALEDYRKSELFRSTWSEVKQWFDAPAEAWTLESF